MKRLLKILGRAALALVGIALVLTGLAYAAYIVYKAPDVTHKKVLQFYYFMGGFAGVAFALVAGFWLIGQAAED